MRDTYEPSCKKRVVRTAEVTVEVWRVYYTLIEEEITDDAGTRIAYSIMAECTGGDDEPDSDYVQDVAVSEDEAVELFALMAEETVMPCTLRDVICDYIAER